MVRQPRAKAIIFGIHVARGRQGVEVMTVSFAQLQLAFRAYIVPRGQVAVVQRIAPS